jgi:hypothetical protein
MSDFSIELSAERIVDSRTRRFFSEVYGCYAAGYYRSSVVMLWSVVVTDIMFKLDQLATAYADPTAQAILTEIGDLRKNNPKSPEWETELVNKVASRTDMLDHAEHSFLTSLQTHRHLSAHPVMTSFDVLYSPNKETARAHIRNALEAVLTKPPIMSRKVFDSFIEDVERLSGLNTGPDGLKRYLEAKYFKHFSIATFAHIFKSMWRVTFKSNDARADANRAINAQALGVTFSCRKNELTELIRSERDWFSDVSFAAGHLVAMEQFFREHPSLFPLFTDALKTPVQNHAELNLDNFARCWFVSANLDSHLEEVLKRVESGQPMRPETFSQLRTSLGNDGASKLCELGMKVYFQSRGYDAADERFEHMVRPMLPFFTRQQVIDFMLGCVNCHGGQATGRRRAKRDHLEIVGLITEKFADVNHEDYPVFAASVE